MTNITHRTIRTYTLTSGAEIVNASNVCSGNNFGKYI
jgi:hypothetical protein